jgi:osmotically inducible protein OsmC
MRFADAEGRSGTNPEELIAAAHAGCFAMALSFQLTGAGFPPTALHVESVITMAQQGFDWSMTGIVLTLDAVVPGIDDATFREKANAAKVGCPVSQALSAVPITLEATLRAE